MVFHKVADGDVPTSGKMVIYVTKRGFVGIGLLKKNGKNLFVVKDGTTSAKTLLKVMLKYENIYSWAYLDIPQSMHPECGLFID